MFNVHILIRKLTHQDNITFRHRRNSLAIFKKLKSVNQSIQIKINKFSLDFCGGKSIEDCEILFPNDQNDKLMLNSNTLLLMRYAACAIACNVVSFSISKL